MINLLVDLHCFDGKPEGITTYLQGIYQALISLAATSIRFYLCASDTAHIQKIFGIHDNVEYITIPKSGLFKRLISIYPRLIKQYNIDYAHFQYTVPFHCKCKRLVTIHDVFFEDFKAGYSWRYALPRHFLFKYAARHAEFVFTMCEYCRERIASHYGISQERIQLTPNAISEHFAEDVAESTLDIKSKYSIPGEYILYLSRKEPRKNHVGLVRSFVESRLWEKGISLALVGGVSLPIIEFDDYMEHLPTDIKKWIRCIDHVEYDELCSWYRQAKAFVFPSLAEGFGIPPLEAATCRLPVLCSNMTSMGEFTFFEENLINPQDEKRMAEKLADLVDVKDKSCLEKIAQTIKEKYSWKTSAKVLLDAIQKDYWQEKATKQVREFCGR